MVFISEDHWIGGGTVPIPDLILIPAPKLTCFRSTLIVRIGAATFGATISVLSQCIADAEAEVSQGGDADEEADEGVEAVEGDGGEPAQAGALENGIADYVGEHRWEAEGAGAERRKAERLRAERRRAGGCKTGGGHV